MSELPSPCYSVASKKRKRLEVKTNGHSAPRQWQQALEEMLPAVQVTLSLSLSLSVRVCVLWGRLSTHVRLILGATAVASDNTTR